MHIQGTLKPRQAAADWKLNLDSALPRWVLEQQYLCPSKALISSCVLKPSRLRPYLWQKTSLCFHLCSNNAHTRQWSGSFAVHWSAATVSRQYLPTIARLHSMPVCESKFSSTKADTECLIPNTKKAGMVTYKTPPTKFDTAGVATGAAHWVKHRETRNRAVSLQKPH